MVSSSADVNTLDDFNSNRITRILTTDFPQYFAIITRIRQEIHAIGPEGGILSSTVVPQVQAIFPEGALTKKIKVGLQVGSHLDHSHASKAKKRGFLGSLGLGRAWRKLFQIRCKQADIGEQDEAVVEKAQDRVECATEEKDSLEQTVSGQINTVSSVALLCQDSKHQEQLKGDNGPPAEDKFEMWVLINKDQKRKSSNLSDRVSEMHLHSKADSIEENVDENVEESLLEISETLALVSSAPSTKLVDEVYRSDSLESIDTCEESEPRKNNIFHILNIRPSRGNSETEADNLNNQGKANGEVTEPVDNQSVGKCASSLPTKLLGKAEKSEKKKPKSIATKGSKDKGKDKPPRQSHSGSIPFVTLFFPRVTLLSKMV